MTAEFSTPTRRKIPMSKNPRNHPVTQRLCPKTIEP
jgi:hypothetical protein